MPETVTIDTPFITLGALLKYCAVCHTGGEAKIAIQSGEVLVNGAVCTQRGKKLRDGDTVSAAGRTIAVKGV